ncbi:MAG: radical SAM family heme chaperone HemW [Gemmatimonadales bacterium]|nr:radical SAM family heme chaperone HemW [Gemmatimonadales bacterium]
MISVRHIYVHVPFCRRRCVYCDFSIAVRKDVPGPGFVAVLQRELELRLHGGLTLGEPLDTIYLGGGTPSLLPPASVAELVGLVRGAPGGKLAESAEITIEANPEDVTPAAAAAWAACGVNRVSLGAQSFVPSVLAWMHRPHGPEATERAVVALRQAGIRSLSLDLIFGVPEGVGADFASDLGRAVALEPDHLSVYGLTVEPRTPLGRWVTRQTVTPAPDERHADEFLLAHELLSSAGYEHYEVSNYARPGCRARHNSAYWTLRPYLGLGPAAHSFAEGTRSWNVGPWAAYERAVARGVEPTEGSERLAADQVRLERAYLGLRTADGADVADLQWPSEAGTRAAEAGWLAIDGDRARLTPAGWLRLDSLAQALTTEPRGG